MSMLPCRPTLPTLQCGQLVPSTMLARSVGCQRYRCLRALPTMLARWCNTGPLNVRGIVACERCLRAIVMVMRVSSVPSTMLARWCNTGPCPLNVRGIVACERCLRAIVMRVSVRAIVMRVSSVPSAHSPHASMRPACTIDNAGPVRWMSEVSLPTSVAYEPFPPASEGCQDSRRTRVAKLQSASESSTEDRVMTGDDDGDDDDGQATSMACRAREDGDWMCHARRAVRTSCRRATSQHVDDHTRHEHAKMTTRCWHAGATPVR